MNMYTLARRRHVKRNLFLLAMFAPIAVYYIIFRIVPMGGLVIAFKDYRLFDGIWGSQWIGLNNFQQLFSDPNMIRVIRNTLTLSLLNILLGFPFPIILALLLNEVKGFWFKRSVQTFVF